MPSDIRAQQARELHHQAQQAEQLAEQLRERRNALIRRLREDDPDRWTYAALASAVGVSPEMIAAILKGRTGRPRRSAGG